MKSETSSVTCRVQLQVSKRFLSGLRNPSTGQVQQFTGAMLVIDLESRISEIFNLGSSSTMMVGGGGWTRLGMGLVGGSNMETWNTGCMARRLSGSCKVTE